MKWWIKYPLIAGVAFYVGSCSKESKIENETYFAYQEKEQWYLKTPYGSKIINDKGEVGTVHDRMNGLLSEKYADLKGSLEKIIKR